MVPVITLPLRDFLAIMLAANFVMPDLEELVADGDMTATTALAASCAFDRAADALDEAVGPSWSEL